MSLWGNLSIIRGFAGLLMLSFLLSSCELAETKQSGSISCEVNERVSPAYEGPSERSYCTISPTYGSPVSITIDGDYEMRPVGVSGLGVVVSGNPIRYAEVEILDSTGNRLQCGELDASGQATLSVPQDASTTYTVRINARGVSGSTYNQASILNCPEKNEVHYITETFTPDSSKTVSLSAPATGDMEGAAFNIFDQISETNDFLRAQVGTCSWPGCSNFTVAPKVEAYWVKGFNPNVYQNAPSSGISFYITGSRHFFILGGIDGDVDSTDTDHFDNSVVIHEYGHFLEDVLSISDSPGGAHFGNSVIDARLAFSEGFANFLQAAVQGDPNYRDTFGTPDGSTGLLLNVPIEEPNGACTIGSTFTGCDIPAVADEGNFREFAVTRTLWDLFDSGGLNTDGDTIDNVFDETWAAFTSATGLSNTNQAFRSMGLLLEVQRDDFAGSTDISSVLADPDNLTGDTREYSYYVEPDGGGCTDFTMTPYWDPTEDSGSFVTSFRVRNNDFLFYKHPGGALNLQLSYTTPDTGGSEERESDLDLFIYNEGGRFGNASDVVGSSQNYYDNDQTTVETETINGNLPAGDYLINVFVYTGTYDQVGCIGNPAVQVCQNDRVEAGDGLEYSLTANGVELCPATRP